jgi:hypothetical protein
MGWRRFSTASSTQLEHLAGPPNKMKMRSTMREGAHHTGVQWNELGGVRPQCAAWAVSYIATFERDDL